MRMVMTATIITTNNTSRAFWPRMCAQIAIKLFGPNLATFRTKANEIRGAMAAVPGFVDLLVEPQVGVPQV